MKDDPEIKRNFICVREKNFPLSFFIYSLKVRSCSDKRLIILEDRKKNQKNNKVNFQIE